MAITQYMVIDNDVIVNMIVVDSNDLSAVVALRKQHQQVLPVLPASAPAGMWPCIGWKRSTGDRFDPTPV